jgi:hypothetical protein
MYLAEVTVPISATRKKRGGFDMRVFRILFLLPRHGSTPTRSWLAALAAAGLLITLAAAPATAAPPATPASDPAVIFEWNAIATTTVTGDTTKAPVEAILYMAFVHAAVYDAVVGVEGRYAPYLLHAHAPSGTSAQAAAVAAAHEVLVTYSPYAQTALDAAYAASLAQIPEGKAKARGIDFGTRAADNLIKQRANDGRNAPIFFTQPPAPGVWRPTPPAFAPMVAPWLGFVTPLLVHSATQFAPPPPPALTSQRYTQDFNEVKALGSATSTVRTSAQTSTALFYSGLANVQGQAMLRDQAALRHLDIVDAARMFAAADMSAADTIISVWHAKYVYGTWRPDTAINLADTDGNPATDADPTWMPLRPDPAYPEYPSGYNGFAAALTRVLERVFSTEQLQLTVISTAVPDVRHYDTGAALRQDVVDGRVWLGLHFRFADIASRDMGLRLTDWTLDHYFQPVHNE